MAIDSSIYSNLPKPDFMGSVQQGMKLRDLMDQKNKQKAIDQAWSSSLKTNPDGTTTFDQGLLMSELGKAGAGKEAFQAKSQFGQMDQAERKAKLEKQMNEVDLISRIAPNVTDQSSYDAGLQTLQKFGVDTSALPKVYDPGLVKQYAGMALTAKDRLDQHWKQMGYDLQKEELGIRRDAARAKAKTSGFGKPPTGYRFKADGSLEPIPGSPQAQATENMKSKRQRDASLVVQDIGRSLDLIENNPRAAGPYDLGLMSYIPGSDAQKLDALLDSAKSNIGFDKLQAMREASPTGGALGNVSEKETAMLQATAGKISSDMPEDLLKENLKRLYNQYNDIIHGPGNGPKRYKLSFDEQGKPLSQNLFTMQSPSGRVISVPENQVSEAKKMGATEIPQDTLRKSAQAELERRRKAKQARVSSGGPSGS